jgi:hypothetical protein
MKVLTAISRMACRAWTNRVVLAFEQGQVQAIAPGENAAVCYDRGIAHQQWEQAIEDVTTALQFDREDEQDLPGPAGRQ